MNGALAGLLALGAALAAARADDFVFRDPEGPCPTADAGHVVFDSRDLDVDVAFEVGGHALCVERSERVPETDEHVSRTTTFASEPALAAVVGRQPDELFVLGSDERGGLVVERWTLVPPPGARTAQRATAATPVGVPVAAPPPKPVHSLVGGRWIPPAEREPLAVERELLYAGGETFGVHYATVDPEGRFLLFLGERDGALYRLDLVGPGRSRPPAVVFDETSLQDIRYMGCVEPRQERRLGRVYVMTTSGRGGSSEPTVDTVFVLVDGDDDGLFDDVRRYTWGSFATARHSSLRWTDTFRGD